MLSIQVYYLFTHDDVSATPQTRKIDLNENPIIIRYVAYNYNIDYMRHAGEKS